MQREPLPPDDAIRNLPPDGGPDFNRLIHETSPYLRQHARNPVDWRPWGPEALETARREDKPVFLSIGYSACHWCHVMEHESFEDEHVAAILNEHFVPVKVDREERPDIDDVYMVATQLMTGRGGWPNSVWLLPDGRPWYAGTYFPREDSPGRIGFITLLSRLAEVWRTRRGDVEQQAAQLTAAIAKRPGAAPDRVVSVDDLLSQAVSTWRESFDSIHGGFGGAPKFPPHSALALLTHLDEKAHDPALRGMLVRTLDAIALGGIHDHVGGGFHRYSTDEEWLLPHFEKMLYDNAQLIRVYAEAGYRLGRRDYLDVARRAADWVLREMTGPEGGFYSALDADSEGEEGRFYVWSHAEILESLGAEDSALFCSHYNILPGGNFHDEATGLATGRNIPHLRDWPADDARLAPLRGRLLNVRAQRVRPGLDDKCLTGWNGLMIGALAHLSQCEDRVTYLRPAQRAARFLLSSARVGGELFRVWRAGNAAVPAFLEDYAGLLHGLVALRVADGHEEWVDIALPLAREMIERFQDTATGMLMPTSNRHEQLIATIPDVFDQAMPSAVALAIGALHDLSLLTDEESLRFAARRALVAALPLAARYPAGCAGLLLAGVKLNQDTISSGVAVIVREIASRAGEPDLYHVPVEVRVPEGWRIERTKSGALFDVICADATVVSVADDGFTLRCGQSDTNRHIDVTLVIRPCNTLSCLMPERHERTVYLL